VNAEGRAQRAENRRTSSCALRSILCALPSALCALILAVPAVAQDVYVPPVPIGIKGAAGKAHTPKDHIPFPDEDKAWVRVRTPRFDILSSAGDEKTREIARNLELLAAALRRDHPASQPATIFVFAKRRESQPYFALLLGDTKSIVTGVYVRHDGGGTMFIDGARPGVEQTALHELIHDLLRQNTLVPPLWIEEGLAEYFSNARVKNDAVFAGGRIAAHVSLLRQKEPASVEQMFAVRTETAEATAPLFYAESWAAVDWLMQLDAAQFEAFMRDVAQGVPPADALATHYGKTLDDLRSAIRNPGRGSREIRIPIPTGTPETGSATPLDRATLLYELGHFLSYVGGAGAESQRHYAEALRVDPKHAPTLAAVGRFDEAIAADPTNAQVHLTFAESLLRDAVGPFAAYFEPKPSDAADFRKARALAERALALGADEGLARGMIGTTYLAESDVTPAIAQLERAHQLAPARMDFALHLYDLYLRTGARAKADALFAAVFDRARDKQTVFAARNLLLRFETDRANALAKSGKLDEAAAIVRSLAAATDDALARRELEQQAAQLAATAAVNRHIAMYNEAVTLANAGRKLEAIKVLDELLRIATDAQVVRDAQALRGKVKAR
jgi:hypothetical protein